MRFKSWIILIVFIISVSSLAWNNGNNNISLDLDSIRSPISISNPKNKLTANETVFGTSTHNPTNPNSNEITRVSVPISDPDGVRNATVFWQYNSINSTQFNLTMAEQTRALVNYGGNNFPRTGFITDTGVETGTATNWKFGEYIYESIPGDILTFMEASILDDGASTLEYVKVESKNVTTGNWVTMLETGSIGGINNDLQQIVYTSNNQSSGYRIYAISYRDSQAGGQQIRDPRLDFVTIDHIVYEADIPPASISVNTPTFVSYTITVFDQLNNSLTSTTRSFLLDWAPQITINDPPSALKGGNDYVLNVTVTDADGVDTINDLKVFAHYQLRGSGTVWETVQLNHLLDFANSALYAGTILGENFTGIEGDLDIIVNATDIVGGVDGREGSSGVFSVVLDSLAPTITTITIEGGIVTTDNITLDTSEVNITAEIEDSAGISSVRIFYSTPDNSISLVQDMINLTFKAIFVSPVTFFATLPAPNATGFVKYFFETTDFFGNAGNSTINEFYSDGAGPSFSNLLIYPKYISNITDVRVLFNATDLAGLKQSILWYSFDDKVTWDNAVAMTIDYNAEIDYQEKFNAQQLPFLITDASTSFLPLEIKRNGKVSQAILNLKISHDNSLDLRIWLTLDSGARFLIFDRETQTMNFDVTIELFDLGMIESDFNNGNFTLEIEDFSEANSGSITDYDIELIHYQIPQGYQFSAQIPRSVNDTTVFFYVTLTDQLDHVINTTTFEYYSDGLVPQISIDSLNSPLDVNGTHAIQISATVTDRSGLVGVDLYYRYSTTENWQIGSMSLNSDGKYQFGIPILTKTGTVYYRVRAFDLAGLTSDTDVFTVEFNNGLAPFITVLDSPYPVLVDLQGANAIRIRANVTDDGNVSVVQIKYRFSDEDDFEIEEMTFDPVEQIYFYDIKVPSKTGNLTFSILAIDDEALSFEIDFITVNYVNATKSGADLGFFVFVFVAAGLLAAGGGGAYYFIRKRRNGIDL